MTNKKDKSQWDRLATKDDAFNAMVVLVVAVAVGITIGFTFLI